MKGLGMSKITVRTALAATALIVSACHKPPPPPQNTTMELPAPEPQPPAAPAPLPEPKPKAEKPVALPTDHAEPSEEEQMREDAEATGMTSRVTTDNDASTPASGGNSSEH
jgi:hypothetical protein